MLMFEGRVVLFYMLNPPEAFAGGIAVLDPRIIDRWGQKFVVGRIPDGPDDWASGLRVSIAFDQVAHFLEFDSIEEYLEKSGPAWNGYGSSSLQ